MTQWLLISGDFTPLGGMDRANHALASYLARQPHADVHLVTHRAWPDLAANGSITVHPVARPLGSHLAGAPLLASAGERWAARLRQTARLVANGGNADAGDVTWVHYVHAAYEPAVAGSASRRAQAALAYRYYTGRERRSLRHARVVLCNSHRTARDVVEKVGVDAARVRTIYYGAHAADLAAVSAAGRDAACRALGWPGDRPVALFIGALGDRRKGFDRLFEAWSRLALDSSWDMDLAVVGEGRELGTWRARSRQAGLETRVKFLGFRTDVAAVIAASSLMVHPVRYEAYGLGVHEAICRGVPALVSGASGIAERYPANLRDLLIDDIESVDELCGRLRECRRHLERLTERMAPFSDALRSRSWDDMAADIVQASLS